MTLHHMLIQDLNKKTKKDGVNYSNAGARFIELQSLLLVLC